VPSVATREVTRTPLGLFGTAHRPHATIKATRPTICYRTSIYHSPICCRTLTRPDSSSTWAYEKRSPDWGRSLGIQGANTTWAEPGPTLVVIQWIQQVCFPDQCLTLRQAAVTTEKITEAARTNSRFVQRTEPQRQVYQSPCQPAEATIAKWGLRKMPMEGK